MHRDDRYVPERVRLVNEVRAKGIQDERVLAALERVERHRFVGTNQEPEAYVDAPLPIGGAQTISQPFTVAYQTELLEVAPGDRVLEIGTGSGYQAAVLAELDVDLYSIERLAQLHERAKRVLNELGYAVHLRLGDGTEGWPEEAPFDGILVTAGGSEIPPVLPDELRAPSRTRRGGRLVIPLGPPDHQVMTRISREASGFRREEFEVFRFVPLVSGGHDRHGP